MGTLDVKAISLSLRTFYFKNFINFYFIYPAPVTLPSGISPSDIL